MCGGPVFEILAVRRVFADPRGSIRQVAFWEEFGRVPEKVLEKKECLGLGDFGAKLGQVQQGLEVSGEGSGEGSGRLWCRARSGSFGFRRRFRRR